MMHSGFNPPGSGAGLLCGDCDEGGQCFCSCEYKYYYVCPSDDFVWDGMASWCTDQHSLGDPCYNGGTCYDIGFSYGLACGTCGKAKGECIVGVDTYVKEW